MNNIVVYCTVMLGYLEYKIQLGKEKTNKQKNKQTNKKKRLFNQISRVKRYILRSKTKEILRVIRNVVDLKSSFDLNTPLTAEYRRRC